MVFFPTRYVASITRYLVIFDGLSLKKAEYILETSSFTPSLAKKNNARVIARNETGPSINRDTNFRWIPQAKTITDLRRRDCDLP